MDDHLVNGHAMSYQSKGCRKASPYGLSKHTQLRKCPGNLTGGFERLVRGSIVYDYDFDRRSCDVTQFQNIRNQTTDLSFLVMYRQYDGKRLGQNFFSRNSRRTTVDVTGKHLLWDLRL